MALVDLITEDVVKVPLAADNKPALLREMVQVLKDAGKIDDFDTVLQAIQDREDKQSTGLEKGIAVPHGKTSAVKSLVIAVGVSNEGIDFNSLDKEPSKLFFMLIAPPDQPGPHVQALAEIAKLAKSPAFLNILIKADSAKAVVSLLRDE